MPLFVSNVQVALVVSTNLPCAKKAAVKIDMTDAIFFCAQKAALKIDVMDAIFFCNA